MTVTIRFKPWNVLGLLLLASNLALFGALVFDGEWYAFPALIGAAAVLSGWAEDTPGRESDT